MQGVQAYSLVREDSITYCGMGPKKQLKETVKQRLASRRKLTSSDLGFFLLLLLSLRCDSLDCNPPGSSVHGISRGSILEWVTISFF